MSLKIQRLSFQDLPQAQGLSELASWNQIPSDWNRLLQLYPEFCFGGFVDQKLVASATAAVFNKQLAWIGMVLVDPSYRGEGFGKEIFGFALEQLLKANFDTIGLDATDLGLPIYSRNGFQKVGLIQRWGGSLRVGRPRTHSAQRIEPKHHIQICEYDRRICGIERSNLISALLKEKEVFGVWLDSQNEVSGYAIVRPGRTAWQIGPLIASDVDVAGALLDCIAKDLVDKPVIVDCFEQPPFEDLLSARGLQSQRVLNRMTYQKTELSLMGKNIFAGVGFEYG